LRSTSITETILSERIDELPDRFDGCQLHSTLTIEGKIPDIIGISPQDRIIAIEAKGDSDIRKGIGQAAHYRQGVHESFLAAERDAVSEYKDTALSCGLGVFGVANEVNQHNPVKNIGAVNLERTRRALAVKSSRFKSAKTTIPSMSRPENSFFPLLAIQEKSPDQTLSISECKEAIESNPDGWRQSSSAISLAETLRLIERPQPSELRITDVGRSGYYLLKGLMEKSETDNLYSFVSQLKSNRILHNAWPEISAFLRDRYLSFPDVRLLTYVLATHDGNRAELSHILAETALASPDTYLNLFCGRGKEKEFRELLEDDFPSTSDENFRKRILELASSNALYNFVYQIRTIGILDEESEAVHQSKELEIGTFHWKWDSEMIGELGGRMQ